MATKRGFSLKEAYGVKHGLAIDDKLGIFVNDFDPNDYDTPDIETGIFVRTNGLIYGKSPTRDWVVLNRIPSHVEIKLSTIQNVTAHQPAAIGFDSVMADLGGEFSTDTHRFTVKHDGVYGLNLAVGLDMQTGFSISLCKNDSDYRLLATGVDRYFLNGQTSIALKADDFIDFRVTTDHGCALNAYSLATVTRIQ